MKKTLIAAALGIIAIASVPGTADAGWGGKGKFKFHHFGHKFHHIHVDHGCYKYKKLFKITGKKFWLKKYYICKL